MSTTPKRPTAKQLAANRANAAKSTGPRTPEGKATAARNGARSRGPRTPEGKAAVAANARRSTGPRTPQGKARSRWNALKHGLRARALIPEPLQAQESAAEFAALHQALRAEFAPATAFEEILVEAIAANYWRLGRVQSAESRGIVSAQDSRRADLEFLAGLRADEARLGAQSGRAPAPNALLPEHITLPDLDQAAILLRYEAHIERQLVRAYNLLERIQRRRRGEPPEG